MSTPEQMRPEQMRTAVARYVEEIHRAYVAQALTFPAAVRGRMPLLAPGPLTVAAVGARNLHVLATRDPLGPPRGPEVEVAGSLEGLSWTVRFFDPIVLPELSLIDESEGPAFGEVRHALGVSTVVYHFVASPGAGLSAHNAAHVGTGLAGGHSAVARDFETIRSRVRGREDLVDEMAGAASAGLVRAHAMLAAAIAPRSEALAALAAEARPDPDAVRRELLAAVGGRKQWQPPARRPRWRSQPSQARASGADRASIVTAVPAGGLSTVRNAARLLKVFRSREADLGVSELARRLGLGKSTVHRMLTTLVAEGLIEQNPRTGGYRLGIVMFELGEAVRVHMDLHAAVGPVLGELRAQTGESSQVGVLDGHEVVYVDRLESAHSLRLFTETGRRVPVHCTSSGKVLLAHLPEARRQVVLRAAPFTALTPHTITDRSQFAAELERVLRRGWAEAVNEREIGVASIAAPVRDISGEVIAAISIGVPLARCSVMALRRLAPVIMEAAEAASRRLGWPGEISRPLQQRKEG